MSLLSEKSGLFNNKRHLVVNFWALFITKLFRVLISFHPVTFVALQSTDEKMSSTTTTSEKVPLIDLRAPPQVKMMCFLTRHMTVAIATLLSCMLCDLHCSM